MSQKENSAYVSGVSLVCKDKDGNIKWTVTIDDTGKVTESEVKQA